MSYASKLPLANLWFGKGPPPPGTSVSGTAPSFPLIARHFCRHPHQPPTGLQRFFVPFILAVALIYVGFQPPCAAREPSTPAKLGMVTTVHPLASQAGTHALSAGGNAVDAAVAAALALGVVDPHNSGIGGGCFLLIRLADDRCLAIDGRETAPSAATRDLFIRDGSAVGALSQDGPLAVGVPGSLAAMAYAVTHHGRLSLREHFLMASRLAEDGFVLDSRQVAFRDQTLAYLDRVYPPTDPNSEADPEADRTGTDISPESSGDSAAIRVIDLPRAADFEGFRAFWRNADGNLPGVGDRQRFPDLAGTYRALAEHSVDWFYRGPFAQQVHRWMQEHGGILTQQDFADYEPKLRSPVRGSYRGYQIVSFPPPSSGGIHLLQILQMLERFDLKAMGDASTAFVHHVAEAMKLAFADRAHWLGDPDFVSVPRGLLDVDYIREHSARIQPDRVLSVPQQGTPPRADSDWFSAEENRHTTHLNAVDKDGNWVALTATINTRFGAKVVVPGTGVILNNEMDDFAAQPGVPNYFGLVGAEANAVEAGKRPLSSMTPTLVFREGQPVLAVGAAGGPTIISTTLLTILRVIDFEMTPEEALARPRFHHQWRPDVLQVEPLGLSRAVLQDLESLGHTLRRLPGIGVVQAIAVSNKDNRILGAHDPKVPGSVESVE